MSQDNLSSGVGSSSKPYFVFSRDLPVGDAWAICWNIGSIVSFVLMSLMMSGRTFLSH